MAEQWLTREEAVELIRQRLNASVGRSQAVFQDAISSREVRARTAAPPREAYYLLADDGIVGDFRPGAKNYGGVKPSSYSKDDLVDWLDRWITRQAPPAVARTAAPARAGT